MEKEKKVMGRPKVPAYRKKNLRYAGVEDKFNAILHLLGSDKDRKVILNVLEELKG